MSEVVKLPGEKEAEAILRDAEVVKNGVKAWVSIGLRMIDVKERLPRGEFTKWVRVHLLQRVAISERHLFQAKAVADHLISIHMVDKQNALFLIDNPAHVIWNDVEGKSTRQLTLGVQDYNRSLDEQAAKLWCAS